MAYRLEGEPVAERVRGRIRDKCRQLQKKGILPTLAIVRIGENGNDIAYERGAVKQANVLGIGIRKFLLSHDISPEEISRVLDEVNASDDIHGCLIFRPLPAKLEQAKVLERLRPEKDVDAATAVSMGGMLTQAGAYFAPCTAAACLELLHHYQIPLKGKKITVIGKGINVGLSIALLLMKEDATVSVCHIFTPPHEVEQLCLESDVIISAAGCAGLVRAGHVRPGQTVIDVGVNVTADGRICGDVDYEAAASVVQAVTPVPGGVGAITTAVLMEHVVDAACRLVLQ